MINKAEGALLLLYFLDHFNTSINANLWNYNRIIIFVDVLHSVPHVQKTICLALHVRFQKKNVLRLDELAKTLEKYLNYLCSSLMFENRASQQKKLISLLVFIGLSQLKSCGRIQTMTGRDNGRIHEKRTFPSFNQFNNFFVIFGDRVEDDGVNLLLFDILLGQYEKVLIIHLFKIYLLYFFLQKLILHFFTNQSENFIRKVYISVRDSKRTFPKVTFTKLLHLFDSYIELMHSFERIIVQPLYFQFTKQILVIIKLLILLIILRKNFLEAISGLELIEECQNVLRSQFRCFHPLKSIKENNAHELVGSIASFFHLFYVSFDTLYGLIQFFTILSVYIYHYNE